MVQRKKIVAIMFTSLANYQELVKEDSKLALELLNEHDKILSTIIKEFFGNIIKHITESIFVEFPSATDAINCSLKIQSDLELLNRSNPKDFQIVVGCGIHMAEVYEENGDLFGDGINLAARIKALTAADEILTTQAVYNSIRSEKNIFVRDIGRVVLKNIDDPERVFKIYPTESKFELETLDIIIQTMKNRGIIFYDHQSIAQEKIDICMHYIHNLGDKDSEFLCYGITDDINNVLNQINGLKTPDMAKIIKSKNLSDFNDLISEYNVDYLVKGSFIKIGNQMRLSISMNNTSNGKELWIDKWECEDKNLPDTKNKILIKILDSIGVDIPKSIQTKSVEHEITPKAYEFYTKGKFTQVNAKNKTDLEIARSLYKKAYESQPSYVVAKTNYARVSMQLGEHEQSIKILEAAEIDAKKFNDIKGLVTVYNNFGLVYKLLGKYNLAIDALSEGLRIVVSEESEIWTMSEKNIQEAVILNTLGQCYTLTSSFSKGIKALKKSIKLRRQEKKMDKILVPLSNLGTAYKKIGDYAKAIELQQETIKILKENDEAQVFLGRTYMNYAHLLYYIGRVEEAEKKYLQAIDICKAFNSLPDLGLIYRHLGLVELNKKDPESAIKYLLKANKTHKEAKHQIAIESTTLFLAQAYLQNDDLDNASKYIKQAIILTNRRRHSDSKNSWSEYWTLPSRCVEALINCHLNIESTTNKSNLDKLFNEIIMIHQDKNKSRELWWLAKGYFMIEQLDKAHECQKLAQEEIYIKAERIRDKKIREEYLTLPPLHKEIFVKLTNDKVSKEEQTKVSQATNTDVNIFKFCPSCGFNNDNAFKFCPSCGGALSKS
jgi:class 3 adenylate cyclase/TolB-like protein/lipopolysaccharide biosynthesis regulator YciM